MEGGEEGVTPETPGLSGGSKKGGGLRGNENAPGCKRGRAEQSLSGTEGVLEGKHLSRLLREGIDSSHRQIKKPEIKRGGMGQCKMKKKEGDADVRKKELSMIGIG